MFHSHLVYQMSLLQGNAAVNTSLLTLSLKAQCLINKSIICFESLFFCWIVSFLLIIEYLGSHVEYKTFFISESYVVCGNYDKLCHQPKPWSLTLWSKTSWCYLSATKCYIPLFKHFVLLWGQNVPHEHY